MTTTSHRPTVDTTHLVGGVEEVGEGEDKLNKMFSYYEEKNNKIMF